MNKWLKRALIGVGAVGVLVGGSLALGSVLADRKAHRVMTLAAVPVALPSDARSLQRGAYLFNSRGCAECHGATGAGRVFASDGDVLLLKSPNITRGPGGLGARYADADWVRTIRDGVKPNGEPVFIMPSEDYARLTDADVSAIAAYAKALPAAPGEGAAFRLPLVMKLLYAAGVIQDAAEKIDHTLAAPAPVPEGVTVAHGKYVANMCIGCHGPGLSGGKLPGHPPSWPAAANLTPGEGSVLPRYPDAESFIAMLRSGKRPDGSAVNRAMPFASLGALSDVDARALHLYLNSLAPRPAGRG